MEDLIKIARDYKGQSFFEKRLEENFLNLMDEILTKLLGRTPNELDRINTEVLTEEDYSVILFNKKRIGVIRVEFEGYEVKLNFEPTNQDA